MIELQQRFFSLFDEGGTCPPDTWAAGVPPSFRLSSICRQDTHSQCTSMQYSFVQKRGTHTTRLAQVITDCISSLCAWKESSRLVSHMSHPCWLLPYRLSPRAPHLPHSLFLLPRHKNIPENTQYITHFSQLSQSTQLRHQASLWRENLQSGGNPRTTTPTAQDPSLSHSTGSALLPRRHCPKSTMKNTKTKKTRQKQGAPFDEP